ncbi:2-dehydro-3-deoxygluconokinase [Clostridium tetanomorphum]|uniref:Sugar kinase n=1 Tax=Clostridium tetanomorphum TaxID=1553 RepID=A0A923EAK9_CLOTT|nr:sugar kinase [Clostridium tetanomorphum]KAJ52603.1 ribokinase-like domain-containing protein [Clostridium tetanomorphum DSM 665]MBC2396843.1 sugar kinase [Clostridium tetanomorphum]MBP1863195.1 2-dehydro-3-deoxygluconokinase [Clostridium tetanomorphum]NRS84303.1 2-dehydro-3-deoxygluconokinase [Clostridium tetanomorphum]NRZ97517.1 2-dehydro-3-deoxygluconokinase [Clostridium tetanomorphum]
MEVLTFGETMIVFTPESNGPLRYVNSFNKSIGGADSNVAIALARLGHKSAWFSKLGNDEFGRYIQSTIRGEGVDVSKLKFTNEASTGLLFKERFSSENPNVYYYRKDSAASKLAVDDLDLEYITQAKIIHITGITPALSESARDVVFKVLNIAKENKITISFDPNIRLKLWTLEEARPVLLDIAKMSDIVLPGISEGEMLLGTSDEKEIANKFIDMGSKVVAVKLGAQGCYVATKDKAIYVKGYSIENPVDTVGAGDGFAAGFLSGILKNLSIEQCGKYGNGVGAMATLVQGDMEGFPYLEQLMTFMGKKKVIDR